MDRQIWSTLDVHFSRNKRVASYRRSTVTVSLLLDSLSLSLPPFLAPFVKDSQQHVKRTDTTGHLSTYPQGRQLDFNGGALLGKM